MWTPFDACTLEHRPATGHRLDLVRPDPGRVDHLAGRDLEGAVCLEVVQPDARHDAVLLDEPDHLDGRETSAPREAAVRTQLEGVPGVVDLGVVERERADEVVGLDAGRQAAYGASRQVAVPGNGTCATQRVVEQQASADVSALPHPVAQRVDELDRFHQVRAELLEHQAPLVQRLPDEPEVELLEIAQPAVDEFARPARRARCPVAHLDEGHRETARRGVQCGSGTGDATTDHEHVVVGASHPVDGFGARLQAEGRCPG